METATAVTREQQVAEALKRMRALRIMEQPIREFKNAGRINKSEFGGILYWIDEKELAMVREFEQAYNAVVYHVIKSVFQEIGVMYSLLYVSQHEEEWARDKEDLANGETFAYVVNESYPRDSEFGHIGVQPNIGGVSRTW